MKTPISYYGGKQMMLKHILPMIPAHTTYCEPFFGGGAVFFAKPKSKQEIINDTNDVLINFYRVAQTRFDELAKEVSCYLYSRSQYYEARDIVLGRVEADDVKKAAALWYHIGAAINGSVGSGFYCSIAKEKSALANKKELLLRGEIAERLKGVVIDNRDALRIIEIYDTSDTFFYIDPPYFNSDMGHYKGYTEADFVALLDKLEAIKGKFLLSSYPYSGLNRDGFRQLKLNKNISASTITGGGGRKKTKTECLTYNYSFVGEPLNLFEGVEGKGE